VQKIATETNRAMKKQKWLRGTTNPIDPKKGGKNSKEKKHEYEQGSRQTENKSKKNTSKKQGNGR